MPGRIYDCQFREYFLKSANFLITTEVAFTLIEDFFWKYTDSVTPNPSLEYHTFNWLILP